MYIVCRASMVFHVCKEATGLYSWFTTGIHGWKRQALSLYDTWCTSQRKREELLYVQ